MSGDLDEDGGGAPDIFRRTTGALLGAAAALGGAWAWREMLIAGWGFDPILPDHWQAIGGQIAWWWRGRVPGLSTLFFATLLLMPAVVALLARALARRGLSRDNMFVLAMLSVVRFLAWCARIVSTRAAARARPADRAETGIGAKAMPAAPPRRADETGDEPALPTPVAAPETDDAPPTAAKKSRAGLTVGEDIPEAVEEAASPPPAADGGMEMEEAPVTIDDLTSKTLLWLRDNGWDCAARLHVDADRGAISFRGDAMDDDPTAVIPLAAFSAGEIWLLRLVDLAGRDWEAAACDLDRRGIPAWYPLADGDAEMLEYRHAAIDCPFSLALRARARFLAQHVTFLDFMGYGPSNVNAAVITVSGGIENLDRVSIDWDRQQIHHLALDGSTEGLGSLFGEPVDKAAMNAEVVYEIVKASGEIEKTLRQRDAA